ncbi:MAG: outer membrane beta-barrel protein [Phycisphaerales bacterium]|nr:outer membrane beta-barrel protein [Phycisphaerales bacterium]
MNGSYYKILLFVSIFLYSVVFSFASSNFKYRFLNNGSQDWKYYFGINFSSSYSALAINPSNKFNTTDSLANITQSPNYGFGLGLTGTLRIFKKLFIRTNPELILSNGYNLLFQVKNTKTGTFSFLKQKINSNRFVFPIDFKYASDRIGNFNLFVLAGCKYYVDLASNAKSRNTIEYIQLKSSGFLLSTGLGFSFHLPFVTLSPEVNFSYGVSNIIRSDVNSFIANSINSVYPRTVSFTLLLED